MNVYFDYQIFYLQRYGGISRYFTELTIALNQLNTVDARIIAPYNGNEYLNEQAIAPHVFRLNPLAKKILHNRFLNMQQLTNEKIAQFFCNRGEKTILHETYYTNRVKVKCPKVITIHDMIYELYNKGSEVEQTLIERKKEAIQEADAIITVSENTKRDLINFYPESKNKIVVVHHGVDQSPHSEIQKYQHPKPFVLHVGNRGWYKNFELLLSTFSENHEFYSACDLISFGGGPMTKGEEVLLKKAGILDNVKFILGSDELLTSLYKSALALVYISNYEGFGMPVLEAMVQGCPVISSNTSALPEVYGNAALSVNPHEANELKTALARIIADAHLREQLSDAGRANASKFTWEKCAEETFAVYQSLL